MKFRTQGFTCARCYTHMSGLDAFGGGLLPESHLTSLLIDEGFTDCFVTLETRSLGWLGLTCRQTDPPNNKEENNIRDVCRSFPRRPTRS